MDDGKPFDVVYFDFAKAFDVVCHRRLLIKIEAIGITGKLKAWIKDWLTGRKQRVIVDGEMSEWIEVVSGVLQGTVLGGTLFNIFVNDLVELIKSIILMFADDTKIAHSIESEEDAKELQEDIDRLGAWATEWGMRFNVSKCKVMHLGRRNIKYQYKMEGKEIEVTEEEKDLGVWMSNDMKPETHCEKAALSANTVLGMISRSFHYRTKETLIPLYKTFVRPRMEFAASVWNPWTEKDSEILESIQRKMMRMVSNARGSTYEEKLEDAGLTTLKERRIRGDMIETFKTMKGFNQIEIDQWFERRRAEGNRPTRSNTTVNNGMPVARPDVLYKGKANLEVRNNFFTVRVVRTWNDLPDEVKNQASVNGFKNAYDRWRKKGRIDEQHQQQQ